MFYADGNEVEIMQPLVDKFNAANPDIVVKLDVVPYKTIDEQLPIQAKAGEAPDMARITNFGAFRGLLLDLRPLLKDAAYFEANFPAPVLAAMRGEGDVDGLHGYPQTLTVTGPFANKTLFDQAGVALPGEGATWEDWAAATKEVAEKTGTPYALTIDRTGHRLASPVLSEGATLLTPDGKFTVDTPGFRKFAEELKKWHDEGLAPKEIWLASENTPCINLFKSAQLVFCLAGSWQTGGLAKDVGDAFDWVVVPTPTGAGGSVGIAGGDGVVAFAGTEHPEAVARFMEYLVQPEVYGEFSAGTLSLPAHAEVAQERGGVQDRGPAGGGGLERLHGEHPQDQRAGLGAEREPVRVCLLPQRGDAHQPVHRRRTDPGRGADEPAEGHRRRHCCWRLVESRSTLRVAWSRTRFLSMQIVWFGYSTSGRWLPGSGGRPPLPGSHLPEVEGSPRAGPWPVRLKTELRTATA